MVNIRFKNAFSEVYEILKYLREDEYNKISEDFLKIVEKYRNKEYEFVLEDNIELKNRGEDYPMYSDGCKNTTESEREFSLQIHFPHFCL